MNSFYLPEIKDGINFLSPEESKHAVKVLRLKSGDSIQILDGKGGNYTVEINEANHKKTFFSILDKEQQKASSHYIHIAIAPTKNIDRIEWFVEKAVEIGIHEISFIVCKNSERKVLKIDRIHRKAVSAMKQSMNTFLPKINELTSYEDFLQNIAATEKYIAFVDFENPIQLKNVITPKNNYCILIGPEGDFTIDELNQAIDLDFQKVSLGNSRLRTETAGIIACHFFQFIQ